MEPNTNTVQKFGTFHAVSPRQQSGTQNTHITNLLYSFSSSVCVNASLVVMQIRVQQDCNEMCNIGDASVGPHLEEESLNKPRSSRLWLTMVFTTCLQRSSVTWMWNNNKLLPWRMCVIDFVFTVCFLLYNKNKSNCWWSKTFDWCCTLLTNSTAGLIGNCENDAVCNWI